MALWVHELNHIAIYHIQITFGRRLNSDFTTTDNCAIH